MRFTVVLLPEPEIEGFVAYVPAAGVATQGYSIDHALEMAVEAATLKLEVMADRNDELPVEHAGAIVTTVDIPLKEPVIVGDDGVARVQANGDRP